MITNITLSDAPWEVFNRYILLSIGFTNSGIAYTSTSPCSSSSRPVSLTTAMSPVATSLIHILTDVTSTAYNHQSHSSVVTTSGTLPSLIDSRWIPHFPHGVQVEIFWQAALPNYFLVPDGLHPIPPHLTQEEPLFSELHLDSKLPK